MATAAKRMQDMRERRRARGLRELRLVVPDARDPEVRARVARQVAQLDPASEEESLNWIEAMTADEQIEDFLPFETR